MTYIDPKADNPLAAWRANPFFVLGVEPRAGRSEIERAGQKLLALLAVGAASATRYDTPFGPAMRDADSVRAALAALRDPVERLAHELILELTLGGALHEPYAPPDWEAAVAAILRSDTWLNC
jgi:hypothetical protein